MSHQNNLFAPNSGAVTGLEVRARSVARSGVYAGCERMRAVQKRHDPAGDAGALICRQLPALPARRKCCRILKQRGQAGKRQSGVCVSFRHSRTDACFGGEVEAITSKFIR